MRQKPHFTDMSPPVSWCFSVCKMRFLLSTIKYSCKIRIKYFIIKKIQYCIAPDQSQAFLPISVLHKIVSTSIPTHTKTIHFMPPTTAPAILLIPRMTGSLARRSMHTPAHGSGLRKVCMIPKRKTVHCYIGQISGNIPCKCINRQILIH